MQSWRPVRRVAELGSLGGNFSRTPMFNHQTMKTKFDIKSIVCGVLLGAGIVFTVGAATAVPKITWEYRVLKGQPVSEMESALNVAAAEGWELVGVATDTNVGAFTVVRRAKK